MKEKKTSGVRQRRVPKRKALDTWASELRPKFREQGMET